MLNRSNDAEKLCKRMLWAIGVKSKDLDLCMSDEPQDNEWSTKRVRATFTSRQLPLYTVLTERPMRALLNNSLATEYMELVVGATVVPKAPSLPEILVDLGRDEDGGHVSLHNRPELWKQVESRPRLRPVDLLAAIEIDLENEFRIMGFDYLVFQRACSELGERLFLQTFAGQARDIVSGNSEKVFAVTMSFASIYHPMKLVFLAEVFENWLAEYAQVGTKNMPAEISSVQYPLRLTPELVMHVKSIVQRRGLSSSMFTTEQLYGMNISASETKPFEDLIRDKYSPKAKRASKRK